MPGTRNPNATLCHSEHSEESREERKEILRFALNDKLIVNCQWLIVMRGTRNPNATLCHSERSEESREEEERDSSLTL